MKGGGLLLIFITGGGGGGGVTRTMAVQRSGASCHLVPNHHQTQNSALRFEDSRLVWVDSGGKKK